MTDTKKEVKGIIIDVNNILIHNFDVKNGFKIKSVIEKQIELPITKSKPIGFIQQGNGQGCAVARVILTNDDYEGRVD